MWRLQKNDYLKKRSFGIGGFQKATQMTDHNKWAVERKEKKRKIMMTNEFLEET